MKTCITCSVEKPLFEFTSHKETKDRLYPVCKACKKLKDKEIYQQKSEKKKEQRRLHYLKTQAYTREKQTEYYLNNKQLFNRHAADRRARIMKATPSWADKQEIQYYYNLAVYFTEMSGGFVKYHVDHIVPLRGKDVCGLHVQNNLQVLKSVDNLRKSNKCQQA